MTLKDRLIEAMKKYSKSEPDVRVYESHIRALVTDLCHCVNELNERLKKLENGEES